MKYLLAIVLSLSMILVAVPSAKADNSEEVIIGVMGGLIGGLVIGEALNDRHHHHRKRYRREYIYIEREPRCYNRWFEAWDPYLEDYVRVNRRVCEY